ncbi:MAG: DNA-processing protein DprA [Blautia sp.]|nr:DNA-processing protein DprA [Blautia sp.]
MYGLWFSNISGITPCKRQLILESCASAEELYGLSDAALRRLPGLEEADKERILESRRKWNLEGEWMKLKERGIGFVTIEEEAYPQRLRNIPKPPYCLYYLGNLPDSAKRSVAIVGARGRSAYGSQIARTLAKELARADVDVVSGMARGIDADGHMGVLDVSGRTYAVLGCGIDVCYPAGNRHLYEKIPVKGGILSEYPLGTAPRPMLFPQRNRIISGLCEYTVVIEARSRSGSLITADYALEQGREVYALPGRITDELSGGCNELIRQGAGVLVSVESFMEELSLNSVQNCVQMDFRKNLLEKDEQLVYSLFDFAPLGIGSLVQNGPYGLLELIGILERLEQKGWIEETVPNYYRKKL